MSLSFKHSADAESSQYFPINVFHIKLHNRWNICILWSTYCSSLRRSDMLLISGFTFSFVTSTPFSMCFAVDVETTHSKRILSFFALLNFMNGTINGIVFLRIFWRWKTYNCQRCTFWSSSFLKQGNLWICQYQLTKNPPFF